MHKLLTLIFFVSAGFLASCQGPTVTTSQTVNKPENANAAVTNLNANRPEIPKANVETKPIQVEIDGKQSELVLAKEVIPNLVEDLKYATADNFMRRELYTDPRCYLLKETAEKLSLADKELSERKPGFRLKVWDCYRPMKIQQEMWKEYTNTPYVANPKTARHPRGRAVDISIVDASGNEVEMPTKYDDFTPNAHPNAPTTPKAAANRELLRSVMTSVGFSGVNSEWWHFDNLASSPNPAKMGALSSALINLFARIVERTRQPDFHTHDTVYVSISGFVYELASGKLVKSSSKAPKQCGNIVDIDHTLLNATMEGLAGGGSLWEGGGNKWKQIGSDEGIGYQYDDLRNQGVPKYVLKCLNIQPL